MHQKSFFFTARLCRGSHAKDFKIFRYVVSFCRNKNSAQRGSFWPDIPADIRLKASVRPSNPGKTSILERTSRADVHEKNSDLKNFGLTYPSLFLDRFSEGTAFRDFHLSGPSSCRVDFTMQFFTTCVDFAGILLWILLWIFQVSCCPSFQGTKSPKLPSNPLRKFTETTQKNCFQII